MNIYIYAYIYIHIINYTKTGFLCSVFSVVPSRLARGAGCQPPQASFGAGDEVGGEMTGRRKIGAIKNWYLFNPLHIEYNMMYIAFKVCTIIDSILT